MEGSVAIRNLSNNFWIKNTFFNWINFFLYLFKNKIIFNFVQFLATKKERQLKKLPPSLFCCYWIRVQGRKKIRLRIRNRHSGSATLMEGDVRFMLRFCKAVTLYTVKCFSVYIWWRNCKFYHRSFVSIFIPGPGCPDPGWFFPDPAKSFGSDRTRIRNTLSVIPGVSECRGRSWGTRVWRGRGGRLRSAAPGPARPAPPCL